MHRGFGASQSLFCISESGIGNAGGWGRGEKWLSITTAKSGRANAPAFCAATATNAVNVEDMADSAQRWKCTT